MLESLILQFPMGTEWIWIIVIVGVLFFGAKKIPELARTLGKSKGEFEKGKMDGDKELKDLNEKKSGETS